MQKASIIHEPLVPRTFRLLAELENHPDKYPRTIALRTEEGTLKITKSNFKKALADLIAEHYIAA